MNSEIFLRTKLGNFLIESSGLGIKRISFSKAQKKAAPERMNGSNLKKFCQLFEKYAEGRNVSFSGIKMDLSGLTLSHQAVLKELFKVKKGDLVSYQELANRAGFPRAARFVGSAMRKNPLPILIPCHRVIGANGTLGGYTPGPRIKRRILKMEGIQVRGNKIKNSFKQAPS